MNPVVLALDLHDPTKIRSLISSVRDYIGMIKIGTELWAQMGPASLEFGREFNLPMFLDLKLFDIPNTVARTIDVIANKNSAYYSIPFVTVHAFGGSEMLSQAVKAAGPHVKVAAVTLLTSMNWKSLEELGFSDRREGPRTIALAKIASQQGVSSFVCSPDQAKLMRKHFGDSSVTTLITPGIRTGNEADDDQIRVQTPSAAIRAGADYIVVGRPITQAPDPVAAAKNILLQVEKVQ